MANPSGNPRNLRPFPKGVSGNPGGRRAGLSLTRLIRDELQQPADDGSGHTKAEALAETIVNLAVAGDRVFAPLVWRYVDGDPKDAARATLRDLAHELGERLGLNPDELLAAFERDMGLTGA